MSKSLDNHLAPHQDYQELITRTRKMITDPQKIRLNGPGRPEICSVYTIHDIYNQNREVVAEECRAGERGCVACKDELSKALYERFEEFRGRRAEYESKPGEIKEILYEGSKKAGEIAGRILDETLDAMKVRF